MSWDVIGVVTIGRGCGYLGSRFDDVVVVVGWGGGGGGGGDW